MNSLRCVALKKCDLIFKFFYSKNMNKKLKFSHNMHN